MRKLRCREVFSCDEREFPAYRAKDLRCWLSSVLRVMPHAVIGLRKRKIIFANEAVEKVFGWTADEVIGKSARVLYRTEEEFEEIGARFYPFLEGNHTHSGEFPCRRKDGRDIFCMVTAAVTGERLQEKEIVAVYEDITERKKTEEAVRERERKYLDLYRNAPDGYHSLGPDGTILEVNDTWLRMLGYDRDEVIGKMKLVDLLTDEGIKTFVANFTDLKEKGSVENVDYSLKKKDGTTLPALFNATAVYDEKGNFLKTRAIVRDNSYKKTYETKLERASAEWRATFDSLPYGVLLLDADTNIVRVNRYISELYGIPFSNIVEKNFCELNFSNEGLKEFCAALKSKTTAGPQIFEYFDENQNKHFMLHETVLFEEEVIKAYVLSLIDVSEIKNKEKRLTESKDAFFNMLKELDVSYKELKGLYESLIRSFINAIDAKSPWTKGHSDRVTHYAVSIAKEMGLREKDIDTLRTAALLHDVGKIGTYDIILDKPGKLAEDEFALIRMHPVRGEEILRPIKQFSCLLPIVRHHHERIDGKGYPDGLKGREIPLLSKIIAVADSFDSMTSDRPYRPSPPREYAISELRRCSGTQFEPQAVEIFLRLLERPEKGISENPDIMLETLKTDLTY